MSQHLSYTLIRLYLVLCLPQINSKHVVDVFAILLLVLAHLDYGYSIMDIVLVLQANPKELLVFLDGY